jgi:hypothetical protein
MQAAARDIPFRDFHGRWRRFNACSPNLNANTHGGAGRPGWRHASQRQTRTLQITDINGRWLPPSAIYSVVQRGG